MVTATERRSPFTSKIWARLRTWTTGEKKVVALEDTALKIGMETGKAGGATKERDKGEGRGMGHPWSAGAQPSWTGKSGSVRRLMTETWESRKRKKKGKGKLEEAGEVAFKVEKKSRATLKPKKKKWKGGHKKQKNRFGKGSWLKLRTICLR